MSDEQLKADVERVDEIATSSAAFPSQQEAWQRLRARLEAVPDEDAVTEAVQKEAAGWATYLSDFEARQIAIAAIAAIKGDTK